MNLQNMDYLEYKNIFEIDNIKRVMISCIFSNINIQKSDLSYKDKRKIKQHNKDVKYLCYKLITRNGIVTTEDYINSVSTMVSILSKVLQLLRKKEYKKDRNIKRIKSKYYGMIKLISYSETAFQSFFINHRTSVCLIILFLIWGAFFGLFIWAHYLVGILVSLIILMAFYFIGFLFTEKFVSLIENDRINRMIRLNSYVILNKNKKLYHDIKEVIKISKQ